ncbi:MAG: TIGR03032 family protein [Pseudomonadota bacterium]
MSRGFLSFLDQHAISLAITTYQVGKVFILGRKPDGKLWVFNRNVGRCLGMAVTENSLWVASDVQIIRFENALPPGESTREGYDAAFVPQMAYYTGDLDIHDLGIGADGTPVFANTLFNCLATVSATHSFHPVWKPPFISRLAAEDRCHLNGLALVDGKPGYVTAVAESDTFDGWRFQRDGGGIVFDVRNDEIVCRDLSMPHSPRWHDGKLWLHNSGAGQFGFLDADKGAFEPVCFCPGYLRGLTFIDRYAIMGLSKPRHDKTFSGLPLDAALWSRKMEARCGLYVVDLHTGDVAHSVTLEGAITELYDVGVISGTGQPTILGPKSPELKTTISIGPSAD